MNKEWLTRLSQHYGNKEQKIIIKNKKLLKINLNIIFTLFEMVIE